MTNWNELGVPEMITLKEAAARTGLSYNCLRQLCMKGRLVHIRAGSKYLLNFEKLVEYLRNGDQSEEE